MTKSKKILPLFFLEKKSIEARYTASEEKKEVFSLDERRFHGIWSKNVPLHSRFFFQRKLKNFSRRK